jgi:hypothetical protein
MNDKNMRAHRASWEFFRGQIPADMQVLHACNVRRCVRPLHLYLGDHQQNMDDRAVAGNYPRGEAHCSSKISDVERARIFLERRAGTKIREILGAYPIRRSRLYQILNEVEHHELQ